MLNLLDPQIESLFTPMRSKTFYGRLNAQSARFLRQSDHHTGNCGITALQKAIFGEKNERALIYQFNFIHSEHSFHKKVTKALASGFHLRNSEWVNDGEIRDVIYAAVIANAGLTNHTSIYLLI